jgi:predicted esterase
MSLRSTAWVFLALLLLSAPARADEKITKESLESRGGKRTYYLFVPASAKASAPLVVLLHGSGHNGLSLMEKWKDLAEREGFILAGPDSSDPRGWRVPEDGPEFIRDLVETLKQKHPVNPRRVYLFGHSAGAVFALSLSMMESEYFAATSIHAGSWRRESDFSVIRYATRKTPLSIFVGDKDAFFPVDSVRATESALKQNGFGTVEVTVLKNHTHWYYDVAADINRDAWGFLRKHELSGEPKYKAYNFGTAGGGAGGSDDFNAAVREINALRTKASDALRSFYGLEDKLRATDRVKEPAAAANIAREQAALLETSANAYRESAAKAGQAGGRKLPGNAAQYFTLIAQADAKRAEALDAMRERAQVMLGDDPPDVRTSKMNAAVARAEKLHREADALEQQAERVRAGQFN